MVDWSGYESLWYRYDIDTGVVSCVQKSVQRGRNRQIEDAVIAGCKPLEVPVNFVKGRSMSLSALKLQEHQFLSTWYPANLKQSPTAAPQEVASISVLSVDPAGGADWYSFVLKGGSNLCSRSSNPGDCRGLFEAGTVVSESIPLSVPQKLQLAVPDVEVTCRVSSWKGVYVL